MATATSPTAPQFVQQAFRWEELESAPVVVKSSSVRRGRCEHVGGILASVLERYGIGIDELVAEIDGMK